MWGGGVGVVQNKQWNIHKKKKEKKKKKLPNQYFVLFSSKLTNIKIIIKSKMYILRNNGFINWI